jgi:ribosomal protein L32
MKNNIIKCSICNKLFNEKTYNFHLKSSDNTHKKLYNKMIKNKSPIKYTQEEKKNVNKKFLKNLENQLIQEEKHSSYIPSAKKVEKTKEEIEKEFIERLDKEIEKDKITYKHIKYKSQNQIYIEQNNKIKNDYLKKINLEIEKYEKEKDEKPHKEIKKNIEENEGKYSNIENLIQDDIKNKKNIELVACPNCGRKFFENRINFHTKVCKGKINKK